MREFEGKRCFLQIKKGDQLLNFTANPVTSVTNTHINFKDKFGVSYSYLIQDIVEIHEDDQNG